jgi:signal transduction histidine kinase/CheY-like chemotaxis protein/HPt (histidine-containing phosphotransfer) domain-containing protein
MHDFKAIAHLYQSILDAIDIPITVTNKDMEWTFINRAVEKFLNINRENVMGKKCCNWNANICNTENCGIARLRNGNSETLFEQYGGTFHVDVSYLYDEKGDAIGHVEVVKDITKVIELTKRQAEAEAANRAKSDFLAKVSHEIRTPMNAILGIAEIQLQREELAPDIQEAFGEIYNSGYLLLNIINDILDLSKIEAGKLELVPVNYSIASLINDTAHLNVMRYDSKPIDFSVQADEHIPSTLFGDELRIKQILNNLLSNAFKYTSEGEISLKITAEAIAGEPAVMLVFRVSDTGQGMTEEQVSKLFDEYTRFNLKANRTTVGTGLGMSITKHLVRMMNGEITVESKPGIGSAFTVRFPQGTVGSKVLGKEAAESLKQFQLGKAMQMKKMPQINYEFMPHGKVLIVDDVGTNLYVARGLLTPYGLSIDTASSGFEAIDKIKKGAAFDIIFMDHFMPQMDGMETTKKLRDLGYAHPIVALTANAIVGQAEMFLKNGFDAFISKPIDIRQLNAILNKYVRGKQPRKAIERGSAPEIDSALRDVFLLDAKKALPVLESVSKNINEAGEEELHLFMVNAHAMKSALANIGQPIASQHAFVLEKAGREQNRNVIRAQAKILINDIQEIIERFEAKSGETDVNEDAAYLREQMQIICDACANYDESAVIDSLKALKKLSWKKETSSVIDKISEHILFSNFEEAEALAAELKNSLSG